MARKARTPGKNDLRGDKNEFWQRMREILPETEHQAFENALSEIVARPERSLRLNTLRKITPELLTENGFSNLRPIAWEPAGFFAEVSGALDVNPVVGAGLIYLQEAGAMEAVEMLEVQPGELVLDLCAAPGGKSTQIGDHLKGEGWLVANDPVRGRAERLDALLARHGVLNASVFSLDPTNLAERFPEFFDRILVDAPCSGESLFAKRTEKRTDVRDVDVAGCARRQFTILSRAAEMLKPGGRIVYSTCTYSKEENEDLVAAFLSNHRKFELAGEQRRWPHRDGVAGGYAAILKKAGELFEVSVRDIFRNPEQGAIRHGPVRWDGEMDHYAVAMSGLGRAPTEKVFELLDQPVLEFPKVSLDDQGARAYLSGQVLPNFEKTQGLLVPTWKGFALGLAKGVEDRKNNLLPKILRGLS